MNPTTLAEQATLGTLLVDPAQIAAVQGFLRPTDFLTIWHRNIYAAMLARHQAQQPVTAKDIHADLVAAGHPDENSRGVRLVALMEIPPAHPQARRYAVMVLEASLRRQVRDFGVLLRAGAVVAAADIAGPDAAHAGPFAEIDAQLCDARRRWAAACAGTIDPPASTDTNLDPASADRIDIALKAARLVDQVHSTDVRTDSSRRTECALRGARRPNTTGCRPRPHHRLAVHQRRAPGHLRGHLRPR